MSEVVKKFQLRVSGKSASLSLGELHVNVRFTDTADGEMAFGHKSKYGRMYHNRYRVTLTNRNTGKRCSFIFHDSAANTSGKPIYHDDLGYSVMACIKMDWNYTKEMYPTFEDFAREFGYDTDSRRAERTYKACIRLGEKLQAVVDRELLEKLPN